MVSVCPEQKSYLYISNTFQSILDYVKCSGEASSSGMNLSSPKVGEEMQQNCPNWAVSGLLYFWAKFVFVAIDPTGFEDCPTYKNCIVRILDGFPYWYDVSCFSSDNSSDSIWCQDHTLLSDNQSFNQKCCWYDENWAIVIRVDSQRLRAL